MRLRLNSVTMIPTLQSKYDSYQPLEGLQEESEENSTTGQTLSSTSPSTKRSGSRKKILLLSLACVLTTAYYFTTPDTAAIFGTLQSPAVSYQERVDFDIEGAASGDFTGLNSLCKETVWQKERWISCDPIKGGVGQ